LKHKVILIVVLIIVGGVMAWRACNPSLSPQEKELRLQNQTAPLVKTAPYIMQTSTRYYYLVKYKEISDKVAVLYVWYEWDGSKWNLITDTKGLIFRESMRIYKRE
jgi:hypothetical protein